MPLTKIGIAYGGLTDDEIRTSTTVKPISPVSLIYKMTGAEIEVPDPVVISILAYYKGINSELDIKLKGAELEEEITFKYKKLARRVFESELEVSASIEKISNKISIELFSEIIKSGVSVEMLACFIENGIDVSYSASKKSATIEVAKNAVFALNDMKIDLTGKEINTELLSKVFGKKINESLIREFISAKIKNDSDLQNFLNNE